MNAITGLPRVVLASALFVVSASWAAGLLAPVDAGLLLGGCAGCSTTTHYPGYCFGLSELGGPECTGGYNYCDSTVQSGRGKCCTSNSRAACTEANCIPQASSWCYSTEGNPCPSTCPPGTP